MNISEWIGDNEEALKVMTENYVNNIRVAIPAIIVQFDPQNKQRQYKLLLKTHYKGSL